MKESLKQRIHELRKLGKSNQSTVYFASWQGMRDQIARKYSNMFMTSSTVTPLLRKLALQYRNGLLLTYKLLKRYKLSTSSICPLCGSEDGGHHAVSACKNVSTSVTNRHNDAGAAIVAAIYKGTRGGELLTADVGLNRTRDTEGLPQELHLRKKIPRESLPNTMPDTLKEQLAKQSIPDVLLYRYDTDTSTRHYTIVEIKYCRDTKTEDQEARATAQHQQLKSTLLEADPEAQVLYCTLMLGVSGTIYNDFIRHMKRDLGVTGQLLETLLRRLHHLAIQNLGKVWRQRRALINKALGVKPARRCGNKRTAGTTPCHRKTKKKKS